MDRRELLRRLVGGLLGARAVDVLLGQELEAQTPGGEEGGYRARGRAPFGDVTLVVEGHRYHPTGLSHYWEVDSMEAPSAPAWSGVGSGCVTVSVGRVHAELHLTDQVSYHNLQGGTELNVGRPLVASLEWRGPERGWTGDEVRFYSHLALARLQQERTLQQERDYER